MSASALRDQGPHGPRRDGERAEEVEEGAQDPRAPGPLPSAEDLAENTGMRMEWDSWNTRSFSILAVLTLFEDIDSY